MHRPDAGYRILGNPAFQHGDTPGIKNHLDVAEVIHFFPEIGNLDTDRLWCFGWLSAFVPVQLLNNKSHGQSIVDQETSVGPGAGVYTVNSRAKFSCQRVARDDNGETTNRTISAAVNVVVGWL